MKDNDFAYEILAESDGDFPRFCELVFEEPLHSGQEGYAANSTSKHNLMCPGNSWGKTEFITRAHLFWNCFKDGIEGISPTKKRFAEYKTLNASYTYDISDVVFERILGYQSELKFINWLVSNVQRRERQIWFRSGGCMKIGSTDNHGKLIEAERYYRITLDEVGYEPELKYLRNKVLVARTIVPHAPAGGRIHYIGTPKEFSDPELYLMFDKGLRRVPGYYARSGPTYENIYLSEQQIADLEEDFKDDPTAARQVLYGEFVSAGGSVFKGYSVRRGVWNHLKYPAPYQEGHMYLSGWDFARKQDHTVGVTVDITRKPYHVVNYTRIPKSDAEWSYIYNVVAEETKRYHVRTVIVDSSGMGGDVIEDTLSKMGLPVEGVNFGGAQGTKKVNIVQSLVDALDELCPIDEDDARDMSRFLDSEKLAKGKFMVRGSIKFPPIEQLIREMVYYSWNDNKLVTDSVMALAMVTYWLRERWVPPAYHGDVLAGLMRR